MNGKILQKCIDKLKSIEESAEVNYVLGMLEALAEMQPSTGETYKDPIKTIPSNSTGAAVQTTPPSTTGGKVEDEMTLLEKNMVAKIPKIDNKDIETH